MGKLIRLRFFEILSICIVISALLSAFAAAGLLFSEILLAIWSFVGMTAFMLINIKMLRNCYCDLRNKPVYYTVNTAAYLIFAAVNTIAYEICSTEIYAWFFSITKFIKYIYAETPAGISLVVFHFAGIASIFLAPFELDGIFIYDDGEELQ